MNNYIFPKDIRISYYKGYPKIGDPIKIRSLYDVVFNDPGLENIPINQTKGAWSAGAMQFYVSDVLGGTEDSTFTDGIIGIDIDKISKYDCEVIYNNFNLICNNFNGLLMCSFSNSYYNKEKTTGGLHIIVRTDRNILTKADYKSVNISYAATFAFVVYKLFGIDIRPRSSSGLDSHLLSIAHRFFLNHSTVKWNEYSSPMTLDSNLLVIVKDWFDEDYDDKKHWFEEKDDFKVVKCDITKFDISTYNGNKINLGHDGRITIENFLASRGWNEQAIFDFMWNICGPDDFAGGDEALRRAIKQTTKTAISKFSNGEISEKIINKAKGLFSKIGIDIEADIVKVYQPISYDFDAVFEEAYEIMKDYKPSRKIENYLKINLTKDQYLTDYKHEINDMIKKYEMTYLVADCMVGKTHYAMNMQSEYGLFDDDFIVHFSGDSIDVCVPYNSVADNKAKSNRKDIKRVKTENIKNFNLDKRNVFIWNTLLPLYEEYFKNGVVKRMVLFFDESQKIVTDDYRWETVFEMFRVLPVMYKHFVFMTGTPAGELDYLKQYFPDYCIIKVDKEIDFVRECKILKYNKFGLGDKINIIEEVINDGKLPLIYSNSKNAEWKEACIEINKQRVDNGEEPLNILVYDRPNAERLIEVNKTNSIKQYDVVIATKYCSVGIDFQKDDKRMRCSIIDFAGERECTFHDIWQFTLRNRKQDTITKIIVNSSEAAYNVKLYNYWYYKSLFADMAKVHTYKMVKPVFEDEEDIDALNFTQEIFQIRKFGKLVNSKENWFDDDKNVMLLGIYYLYVKVFGNMNVIKHMLERRGVIISEIEMEHVVKSKDNAVKKEIYKFFVDNFDEISKIYFGKAQYDKISFQIDINSNDVEEIRDGNIYSRNMRYMDWLIKQFAGKDDWYEILKERDYISPETFAQYNRTFMIAKTMTIKEIKKLKKYNKVMEEEDLDKMVKAMVKEHYAGIMNITNDEFKKALMLSDIIQDYKKILKFSIENIEYIEAIKNAIDEGERIKACDKMLMAMKIKEEETARRKMSNGGKKNGKPITVKWIKNGKEKTFNSMQEAADFFDVSKQVFYNLAKQNKGKLSKVIQVIDSQ